MAGRREFDVDALNDILAVIRGESGAPINSSIQEPLDAFGRVRVSANVTWREFR